MPNNKITGTSSAPIDGSCSARNANFTMGIGANGALGRDVSTIVLGAGRGDLDCLRYLFRDRVNAMSAPGFTQVEAALVTMEAVTIGRLVASHGHPTDIRQFAGALGQASLLFRQGGLDAHGDRFMAETISVLERLAEHGDDFAATSSQALIKLEPTRMIEQIRSVRDRVAKEEQA